MYILRDLDAEGVKGGKTLFGTDAAKEGKCEELIVEVAGEVGNMRLDGCLRVTDSGILADIGNSSSSVYLRQIDAGGGDEFIR